MKDTQGATSSKWVRGGMNRKGAIEELGGHSFFKLTLVIFKLQMKKKKSVYLSSLNEGGHGFFNFFKGGHLQKRLGNPVLHLLIGLLLGLLQGLLMAAM